MPLMAQSIQGLAIASGLTPESTTPLPAIAGTAYRERPIEQTVTGDFTALYSYLLELEKLPHPARISHIRMQKLPDHDGAARMQLTLTVYLAPASPS